MGNGAKALGPAGRAIGLTGAAYNLHKDEGPAKISVGRLRDAKDGD